MSQVHSQPGKTTLSATACEQVMVADRELPDATLEVKVADNSTKDVIETFSPHK